MEQKKMINADDAFNLIDGCIKLSSVHNEMKKQATEVLVGLFSELNKVSQLQKDLDAANITIKSLEKPNKPKK